MLERKSLLRVCLLPLFWTAATANPLLHQALGRKLAAASHLAAELAHMDLQLGDQQPLLPPVWTATAQLTEVVNGKLVEITFESIEQDDVLERGIIRTTRKVPFAPTAFIGTSMEWINTTQFQTKTLFGVEVNGETLDATAAYGAHYNSIFAWLKYAKPGPNVTVNGTSLASWNLHTKTTSLELLVDTHGTPVRFEQTATIPSGNSSYLYHLVYEIVTFTANGTLPRSWDYFRPTDFTHPEPCPSAGHGRLATSGSPPAPVNKSMYIFHPVANFNITMQDLGSIAGDTLFVCTEGLSKGGHDYEWITQYTVEHVPKYGQYQNCNGYGTVKCLGAEDFWVGHEAGMGLGPSPTGSSAGAAGQCVDNPLVGEWYSLPAGGKCAKGHSPGDGTCTWRATRVKTIDSACLFEPALGYLSACKADARAPFPSAVNIFDQAFKLSDPTKGGCPGLQPRSN